MEHHQDKDEGYQALDGVMEKLDYKKDALLETLNAAQETFGYLSEDLLAHVARKLDVPLSHVYSVATFFDLFTFRPLGDFHCLVCEDPACNIAGGQEVFDAARLLAENSFESKVTVSQVRCLGLCDQAPAALVNGKARVNLRAEEVESIFSLSVTCWYPG